MLLALVLFEPSYGWRVREWLAPYGASRTPDDPGVAAQNELLKAELAQTSSILAQVPQAPKNYLAAMVYSRYPLSFKNELLVNAGAKDGVTEGRPVLFQGILIGSVEKVFDDSALVRTVFDSDFKMPVRIGAKGYDGLFIGGVYPKVASIPKSAAVSQGDIVYAAAAGFPYGAPVAVIDSTSTSADNLFTEAALSFAYDASAIQAVLISK